MPNHAIHCAMSKKRTGNDFSELHSWIDKATKELGYDHRIVGHSFTESDMKYIKKYWDEKSGLGEKAVIEWLFHIGIDSLELAFKLSRKNFSYGDRTYNLMHFGFSKTGYIHYRFNRVDECKLDSMFRGEPEERTVKK